MGHTRAPFYAIKTKEIGDQVATTGVPHSGNTNEPPESDAVVEGGLTTGTGGLY